MKYLNKNGLTTLVSKIKETNIKEYADSPIGTILPYGGDTAPTGYLLCDGAAISRTDYADLFAVIGTSFGTGDGTTTFNVPESSATRTTSSSGSATNEVKSVGVNYIIKAKSVALPSDFISAVDEAVERVAESKDSGVATLSTGVTGSIQWYRRGHTVSVVLQSVTVTGTERVITIATGLPKPLGVIYGSINHNLGLAQSYPFAVYADGSLTVHAATGATPTLTSTYGGISYLSDDY